MEKTIRTKHFDIDIFDDGEHEYEGYYLVIMWELDEKDELTGVKKNYYIKGAPELVEKFVTDCDEDLWKYQSRAKLEIELVWQVKGVEELE